jgi:hypothetical protein
MITALLSILRNLKFSDPSIAILSAVPIVLVKQYKI